MDATYDNQSPTHAIPASDSHQPLDPASEGHPIGTATARAQLPQQALLEPPTTPGTRPFTLAELGIMQSHIIVHLNNLVHSNLQAFEANARILADSLYSRASPSQTPSLSSTSSHSPSPPSKSPPSPTWARPSLPIPELNSLLRTQARYTWAIVDTLQQLNELSTTIASTGTNLEGGNFFPSPNPTHSAPSPPSNPLAVTQALTGDNAPLPPSHCAPLPLSRLPATFGVAPTTPSPVIPTPIGVFAPSPPSAGLTTFDPPSSASCHAGREANQSLTRSLLPAPNPTSLPAAVGAVPDVPSSSDSAGTHPSVGINSDSNMSLLTKATEPQAPTTSTQAANFPPPPPVTKLYAIPDLFPLLEPPVLSAVTQHNIPPAELWHLDTRASAVDRNANLSLKLPRMSLSTPPSTMNTGRASPLQRFPTLHCLLIPLTTYFRILHASLAFTLSVTPGVFAVSSYVYLPTPPETLRAASDATQTYLAHLLDLEERYEWGAVLAYHLSFHERRRVEMAVARGNGASGAGFNGWGRADGELMALFLFGREKNGARGVGRCVVAGARTSTGMGTGTGKGAGTPSSRADTGTGSTVSTSGDTGLAGKGKAKGKSGSGKRRR